MVDPKTESAWSKDSNWNEKNFIVFNLDYDSYKKSAQTELTIFTLKTNLKTRI